MPERMTDAISAYQKAAEYYGQAQAARAELLGQLAPATEVEQTAHRALLTAQEQLLQAALELQLPRKTANQRIADGEI